MVINKLWWKLKLILFRLKRTKRFEFTVGEKRDILTTFPPFLKQIPRTASKDSTKPSAINHLSTQISPSTSCQNYSICFWIFRYLRIEDYWKRMQGKGREKTKQKKSQRTRKLSANQYGNSLTQLESIHDFEVSIQKAHGQKFGTGGRRLVKWGNLGEVTGCALIN